LFSPEIAFQYLSSHTFFRVFTDGFELRQPLFKVATD